MNIIDVQDRLKDFSEQQLIKEMQMPSGNAPQFLVLTEIQRRKRMRDDFAKRQAAAEPTVAQEALSASGVPTEGIAGMSEAMAPQSAASDGIGTIMPQTMPQNAPPPAPMPDDMAMGMRSGGLVSYGEELSQRMSNDKIDPFLDEVEQMASNRFGFLDSGGPPQIDVPYENPPQFDLNQQPRILERPGYRGGIKGGGFGPIQAVPFAQSLNRIDRGFRGYSDGGIVNLSTGGGMRIEERRMKNGQIGLFRGNTFLGLKEENKSKGSLAEKIGFGEDRDVLGRIKDALGLQEGGVIKAQNGLPLGLRQRNPGNIRPGANFIGESGAGGGYATFGSDDEGLRAIQRLLMTYGNKYGINTLRGLANRYAPPSDNNPTDNYIDFLSEKTGIGADDEINLAESGSSIIPAIVGFEQGQQPYTKAQIERAIRAAGTDDPAKVAEILGQPLLSEDIASQDLSQEPDMLSSLMGAKAASDDAINPQLVDSGRSSPAAIAAERYKRLGEISAQKAAGNQTTGADMPSGTLTDLPPDAQFFATDQEEKRIREEQEEKATTSFPNYDGPPGQEEFYKQIVESKKRLDRVFDKDYAQPPGDKGDDKVTPKGDGKTSEGNVDIRKTGDTSGAVSLSDEIKALQKRMDKNRESDKWLALAQAGLALMSSDNPTLLGAAGEAGIEGLKAMRDANERYEEGVIDLINARAKLIPKDKMGLSANNVVSLINRLEEDLATGMLSAEEKEQKRLQIIGLKRMIELPEQTFGAKQPPAAAAAS